MNNPNGTNDITEVESGIIADFPYVIIRRDLRYFAEFECAYIGVNKTHPWFGKDYNWEGGELSIPSFVTFADHMTWDYLAGDVSETLQRFDSFGEMIWWIGVDFAHSHCHDCDGNNLYTIEDVKNQLREMAELAAEVSGHTIIGESESVAELADSFVRSL